MDFHHEPLVTELKETSEQPKTREYVTKSAKAQRQHVPTHEDAK